MRTNMTKAKLQAGKPVIGAQVNIPSPSIVEMCSYAGFDFVFIDCEHGAIGLETLEQMTRAADVRGLTSVVRVPRNAADVIGQVLDVGVGGIIVPGVTTEAEAVRAVRAAKFGPQGMRGVGSGRARGYGHLLPVADYAPQANAQTLVVALLEDIDVVDNLDAILEVQDIDVFIVGPNDFTQSMGFVGQTQNPRFQDARNTITNRVLAAGRTMGIRVQDVDDAKRNLDRGFLWLHVALHDMLVRTARQLVEGVGSLI